MNESIFGILLTVANSARVLECPYPFYDWSVFSPGNGKAILSLQAEAEHSEGFITYEFDENAIVAATFNEARRAFVIKARDEREVFVQLLRQGLVLTPASVNQFFSVYGYLLLSVGAAGVEIKSYGIKAAAEADKEKLRRTGVLVSDVVTADVALVSNPSFTRAIRNLTQVL